MIEKLWLTGLIIALSSFGIKVGSAMTAIIYNNAITLKKKIIFVIEIISVYFFLILALYFCIHYFHLFKYYDRFIPILQQGMLVHLIFSAGLIYWGIKLLLKGIGNKRIENPKEVLLLILPCPVCISVIFFAITFANQLFSVPLLYISGIIFLLFMAFPFSILLITFPFRKIINTLNTSFSGIAMLITAIYFFLIVLISPLYQEAKEVYKIAGSTAGNLTLDLKSVIFLSIFIIILLSIGFILKVKNKF